MILLLFYIYTLKESTKITRGSDAWSCPQCTTFHAYMTILNNSDV